MMSFSPPGHERKVRDSNPRGMFQPSRLATEFLNRPDTFRYQWTHRGSNPDRQHAMLESCPLDDGPVLQWTAGDSNPDYRRAKPVSCRLDEQPSFSPLPCTQGRGAFRQ